MRTEDGHMREKGRAAASERQAPHGERKRREAASGGPKPSARRRRPPRASRYVSSFSLKKPERLPFQKKVTWPNFWVSEQAKVATPLRARYSPDTPRISGGGTR